jgi:hypothetical protein
VAEREEDSTARASAVRRSRRVVVHAGTEELGAAAMAERVVDGGVDLARQIWEEEAEEDASEIVGAPSGAREEPVEARVVARPEAERLRGHQAAADRVPALAEQPSDDERREPLHRRSGEAAGEMKEERTQRRR